ncbi:deoxyguanosinetriphosphate triphosphohydrolase [Fulvivirga sp. M361]|uniref:deoxyguanosinetriphosphate triphosphohydrolase n=1 Tax=Fulvivirga sp. M361 TaxID=2594266 RepID=UPI00117AECC1|nr:deoxyguanosinetriphosphate triphosphohydrolase [Fulvivirga sp. M361]TRX53689.1 deoxyguanosinetriphosphate triphosphohydrolase [Fulvivirga sp. M361]
MNWEQLLSDQRLGEKRQGIEKGRSAFEQDYDRIIFSHPFRRLQDKTQVHPLPEDDFVHTRLTHSLEVSSVGRSLGKKVGQVVLERHPVLASGYSVHDFGAIVAAASLTHDIGNPPFGHSGEDAISEFFISGPGKEYKKHVNELEWADLTHFEGNAQGFRILNKERYQGLKLTFATLAAFSKYPRQSIIKEQIKSRCSQKKYGFFQSERQIFETIADQLGLNKHENYSWCRHPLAFLVEAADDICYHLIDLEDGCRMGLVSYEDAVELFAGILGDKFRPEKLKKMDSVNEQIGTLRAIAIGELVQQCTTHFLDKEYDLLQGGFDRALTDSIPAANTLQEVIALSVEKIYRSRQVIETEIAGFEVLPGLLDTLVEAVIAQNINEKGLKRHKAALRLLPSETLKDIETQKGNTYAVIMNCVDFVSGLTDRHAISLYRKIKGISLPNS